MQKGLIAIAVRRVLTQTIFISNKESCKQKSEYVKYANALIINLLLLICNCCGLFAQVIMFPTLGDGACSVSTSYGYLQGVPLRILADEIDTLYSSQGRIDTSAYDYTIYPEQTGPLKVTMRSNGKVYESEITVLEKPQLELIAEVSNDSIKVSLVDESMSCVNEDYYGPVSLRFKVHNMLVSYPIPSLSEAQAWHSLDDILSKLKLENKKPDQILVESETIYSYKTCLAVDVYQCKIRLKP